MRTSGRITSAKRYKIFVSSDKGCTGTVMFQKLKTLCWGGPNIVPRPDWIKTGLIFHDPEQCNAFGLKALKGATKSFQLILGMSK